MIIIGHRGARGLAPENTVAGLKKALEVGVDMIEFDVRVTPEGVAVLHHDKLKSSATDLSTLEEVLKLINNKVPLYIEVKPREKIEPIVEQLKQYKGKYWLGSRSQRTLVKLHKALPNVPKIVIGPVSGIQATWQCRRVDTNLVAMNQWWLWFGFIGLKSKAGYIIFAYTVNNPRKAKRWQKFGLAGVVTDYPDRFKK